MNKIVIVIALCALLIPSLCFAETYVVLNADGTIHTVTEKNVSVLSSGQTLERVDQDFETFCKSLPAFPTQCKKDGTSWIKIPGFNEPKILNLDEVDEWLDDTFGGTELETFASIIFRATSKDTREGYDLMIKKARDNSIAENTISAVIKKLTELGANIGE